VGTPLRGFAHPTDHTSFYTHRGLKRSVTPCTSVLSLEADVQTLRASDIRRRLKREGWAEVRVTKHHTFRKNGATIVVPKGRKPVSPGVMKEIASIAGWG
jgi:predicted RNA binding protein YcfA (HicA-like mRNA interferase family)